MMKRYIISDTHFGHTFLEELGDREPGFEKKILIQLKTLPKDAVLLHLGDICIGMDKKWHELLAAIPNKKVLVMGNHDRKSISWYLDHGRDMVCKELVLEVGDKKILFTHEPKTDHTYDINIHGHQHVKFDRELGKQNRQRCYSCEDEKYKPKELMKILQ